MADHIADAGKIVARPHLSAHREGIVRQNDGFGEGVCAVLDALHAEGRFEAYKAMFRRFFQKADGTPLTDADIGVG